MDIAKKFSYSFHSILLSKLRELYKRSGFLYLLASILIAYGVRAPHPGYTVPQLTAILFVSFLLLALLVIFTSTLYLAKKYSRRSMLCSFREDEIVVEREGKKESKTWGWVRSASETKARLYIDVRARRLRTLIWSKANMSEAELSTMRERLKAKGKM